jgi:WD40 repeat protein
VTNAVCNSPSRQSRADTSSITTLSFSPDGQQLLTGTKRGPLDCGHLSILDLDDLTESYSFSVTRGGRIDETFDVLSAKFTDDGRKVVSCDAGRRVMLWDAKRKKSLVSRHGICRGESWGFESIFASSATFSRGSYLGIVTREQAAIVNMNRMGSPQSLFLGKFSRKRKLGRWPRDTSLDITFDRPPSMAFSVDESLVALPVRNEIRFMETKKGLIRRTTLFAEGVRSLAFSPRDTAWIAAGFQSGNVAIQDVESARFSIFTNHDRVPASTSSLAFDAEGLLIGSVSQNEAKLWEARDKRCCKIVTQPANILAFPPSGPLLATSDSFSGIVHIWDTRFFSHPRDEINVSRTAPPSRTNSPNPRNAVPHPHLNGYREVQRTAYSPRNSSDNMSFDFTAYREQLPPIGIKIQSPQLLATNLFLNATDWTGAISKVSEFSIGGGCFGDVYKGKWVHVPNGARAPPPVAIKVIRPVGFDNPARRQDALIVSVFELTVIPPSYTT